MRVLLACLACLVLSVANAATAQDVTTLLSPSKPKAPEAIALADIPGRADADERYAEEVSLRAARADPLGRLLPQVAHHIAHAPIRMRGTFCGSLAHADPASEWCATVLALGGTLLLAGPDGAPTERAEKILAHTPLGRFGEADELIGALLFLASPAASSFVNGVVLPVDGGFAAYAGV